MDFEHMTDDDRFDLARVKTGPEAEHLRLGEGQFIAELDQLWGENGFWTHLTRDLAGMSYEDTGVASLPYWATTEASEELRENFPKHPSMPGFDPFDPRHRANRPAAS